MFKFWNTSPACLHLPYVGLGLRASETYPWGWQMRLCWRSKTFWTSSWILGGTTWGHFLSCQILTCGQQINSYSTLEFLFVSWIKVEYRAFGVNFIQHKSTSKLSGFAQNNSIKVMAAGNTHSLPGLDLRTGSSRNEY